MKKEERKGLRKRGVKIHPFHLPWIRTCLGTQVCSSAIMLPIFKNLDQHCWDIQIILLLRIDPIITLKWSTLLQCSALNIVFSLMSTFWRLASWHHVYYNTFILVNVVCGHIVLLTKLGYFTIVSHWLNQHTASSQDGVKCYSGTPFKWLFSGECEVAT